jgi:hypothetical protein
VRFKVFCRTGQRAHEAVHSERHHGQLPTAAAAAPERSGLSPLPKPCPRTPATGSLRPRHVPPQGLGSRPPRWSAGGSHGRRAGPTCAVANVAAGSVLGRTWARTSCSTGASPSPLTPI